MNIFGISFLLFIVTQGRFILSETSMTVSSIERLPQLSHLHAVHGESTEG